MEENKYYDGTKLLSLKDLNGNTPEIFLCTTNRTGGKTTFFNRLVVKRFLEGKGKFAIIYRYNYELDDVADKFFKDIGSLFFRSKFMYSERKAKGIYHELFICDKGLDENESGISCGYALALNNADAIKKYSHLFSDIKRMIFDEFQSETNHYCTDEVKKLISVHTTIARGQGEQSRYVPIYMLSNPVSIINPYYTELGISSRLRDDTRFLKGHGYVLEQGFVETASKAFKDSAFNQAFANNSYIAYASEAVYLNDNKAFIEKPKGKSRYMCTIKCMGNNYAIRSFDNEGIVYCDDTPDMSFPIKISVTTDDHNINYVMLKAHQLIVNTMRFYFEKGCFRFKDLSCKDAVMKMISY